MFKSAATSIRNIAAALALLFAAPGFADCGKSSAAWITLEITSPLAAGDEAMEFVEITRDGCITTRYASYHIHAGVYQRALDRAELKALEATIEQTRVRRFDAKAVQSQIRAKEQAQAKAAGLLDQHFIVEDGEIVRIAIDQGNAKARIRYDAPKLHAQAHKSVTALNDLVVFIEHLQLLGADPGKRRVAEATP